MGAKTSRPPRLWPIEPWGGQCTGGAPTGIGVRREPEPAEKAERPASAWFLPVEDRWSASLLTHRHIHPGRAGVRKTSNWFHELREVQELMILPRARPCPKRGK